MLDAQERASLAVVRSLVRAGCVVTAASPLRWSLGGSARGARPLHLDTDPLADPRGYAEAVSALAASVSAEVLLPISDPSVEAILEHRDLLPAGVALPFAPLSVYRAASDKLLIHRLALASGLAIVETAVVQQAGDAVPDDPALYPGVVKPYRSVVGGDGERQKLSVRQVADRESCARVLAELPAEAYPVLVQRRVVGPGEGFFTARWDGRTLGRFAHRRLREKPPSGGVSVFRESIDLDSTFQSQCEALLDALGWDGVAMVECKRDVERGGWRLMEINGRFWGSLQLAIDAGVDFPALLVGAALGVNPSVPPAYSPGVRLRWEWGDVDHLLIRMIRSKNRLSLPKDAPTTLRAMLDFFAFRPNRDRLEVFRAGDPLPFVVETLARIGVSR